MTIYKVTEVTASLLDAIAKLLPQLSSSAQTPTAEYITQMVKNGNTHLLVAEENETIVGMLSLVIVNIPTGCKAWIEDVVTDEAFRGRNIGGQLVEQALVLAQSLGARKVYLTSNPSRVAAHKLYKKCGFTTYDTTLFRFDFPKK